MNADGSGQTRLTMNPARDFAPDWSPDGSKITFESNRDFGNHAIYAMNADGSGQARLTTDPALDFAPVWSPDGTKIAFFTDRDGNFEIYAMNADGTSPTNLTNSPGFDGAPDGQPLVGASDEFKNAATETTGAASRRIAAPDPAEFEAPVDRAKPYH